MGTKQKSTGVLSAYRAHQLQRISPVECIHTILGISYRQQVRLRRTERLIRARKRRALSQLKLALQTAIEQRYVPPSFVKQIAYASNMIELGRERGKSSPHFLLADVRNLISLCTSYPGGNVSYYRLSEPGWSGVLVVGDRDNTFRARLYGFDRETDYHPYGLYTFCVPKCVACTAAPGLLSFRRAQ